MAHKVTFDLPQKELGRANIEFKIYSNGEVLGRLYVSKGTIAWRQKSKSKRSWKLGWHSFDRVMVDQGRKSQGE